MNSSKTLFRPISIGGVEIKNRFVMLPMTTMFADNYYITDAMVDFYEQRAKGGTGLIEIGSVYVSDLFDTEPKYYTTSGAAGAWDDSFIPGWEKLADACHRHGAKVAGQLQLCYEWRPDASKELKVYAPSIDVVSGPFAGMPEAEFTKEELKILVNQYADAAKRLEKAGVDIIEIHAGIGYMVMRFLSKYSNHRDDEYGGSAENRARLLTEIIDAVHESCPGIPIIVRTSADDFMPGGSRIEDLLEIVPIVEKHGIDAWNVQVGFHEAPKPVANFLVPEGEFIHFAKEVKEATDLPVYPGTRITSEKMCEKVVEEGYGDLVGMARSLIADPEFVNKTEAGRTDLIRSCIVCSRCLDHSLLGKPIQCSVNANVANHDMGLPENKPAQGNKHVVIVGSGPAALEAARVLDIRGHRVTLVEKSDRIAGLLNMAQVLNPYLEPYVAYWNALIEEHPNIDIRLNTKATPEYLRSLNPDEVIVAPGGKIIMLDVPGVSNKNVVSSQDVKDLVSGTVPEGKGFLWWSAMQAIKTQGGTVPFMRMGLKMHTLIGKRLVIVGGGFAGLECASSMAEGREVTLVEESKKLGNGIGVVDRKPTINALKGKGVKTLTCTKVKEIKKNGILVENTETHEQMLIECDTILLALGVEEDHALFDEIKSSFPQARLIGDATCPKGTVTRTLEAVNAGFRTAMEM